MRPPHVKASGPARANPVATTSLGSTSALSPSRQQMQQGAVMAPAPNAGRMVEAGQEPPGIERDHGCGSSSDCPPGHGCVYDAVQSRLACVRPDCARDADCPANTVCRVATSLDSGPAVRRCLATGTQREDEACYQLSDVPEELCRADLLCVFGRCGRRCEPGTIGSCPGNRTCLETPDGPGCFPACKEGQCPQGQVCIQDGPLSVCAVQVGEDCHKKGCPEGQRCQTAQRDNAFIFECRRSCSPFNPESCPQGWVCGAGNGTDSVCYQACDFAERKCPSGLTCATVSEDLTLLGCRP
jgi:hypothetical protein